MNKQCSDQRPDPRRRQPDEDYEDEEETLDQTIADSFPASDPPSSIPDPNEEEEDVA
jgi:hypothetical protein